MKYRIAHESASRLRIRTVHHSFSTIEEDKIHYVLDQIPEVRYVYVYNATGDIGISFAGEKQNILDALDILELDAVEVPKDYIDTHDFVRLEEIRRRHLGPKVKAKMRARILAETAFDLIAPMPLQVGYHVYQLITLRNV